MLSPVAEGGRPVGGWPPGMHGQLHRVEWATSPGKSVR
jgi:hypothetical protein